MDTYKQWEGNSNWDATFYENSTFGTIMGSENEFKITEIRNHIIICAVCCIATVLAVLFCCCMVNRCRNSGKTTRRRSRSEICEFNQNSAVIRNRLAGVSVETIVNRPLPLPPDMNRQSGGIPAIPENDYMTPRQGDSFWHMHLEEISQLPPAPPVFPGQLQLLQLEGEGAYTVVIPDDETSLLPPSPMHEFSHNQELREYSEESAYEVPNLLTQMFRSTFHLILSPPTQHRRPPVTISSPTVVLCISTDL
jgi:hypothetical protein